MKCILLLSETVKAAGSGGSRGTRQNSWGGNDVSAGVRSRCTQGNFLARVQRIWRVLGSGEDGRGGFLLRPALWHGVRSSASSWFCGHSPVFW